MSLKLNSSGGGSVTLQEPTTANNQTLTLPDVTGTLVSTASQPSFASTIAVGGATPAASGAGITFPATQSASSDANTLDDYEEGTYTPNVYHSSSNNSTWSQKQGKYTKIGNQVTVWGVCDAGNSGTAGSALRIDLPFTMSGYSNVSGGNATFNGTSANSIALQMFNGFLYVNVRAIGGDYTSQVTYIGFFATYTV